MILADHEIIRAVQHGELLIEPYHEEFVQPASYDMRLDSFFRYYDFPGQSAEPIDPAAEEWRTASERVESGDCYYLMPLSFALASTVERVKMPANLVGRIEGKSSVARLGQFVHITAGFIDPGFDGHITLELFNGCHLPIALYPGMPICQMSFERLGSAAKRPYGHGASGSKYTGTQPRGPVESRYHANFPLPFLEDLDR